MDTQPENLTRRRLLVGAVSLLLISAREIAGAEPAMVGEPSSPDGSLSSSWPRRRYCYYRNGRRICIWR
jgi:hypothetical protein